MPTIGPAARRAPCAPRVAPHAARPSRRRLRAARSARSYLLQLRSPEQALWAHEQDEDEDAEYHHLGPAAAEVSARIGLGQPDEKAAEHRARDRADPAHDSRSETLEPGEE